MSDAIEIQRPATPIAAPQEPAGGGLSPLVQAAMSGALDTEKLRELLQIQKDYEANEARKAYHRAVAAFKANAPTIRKDKRVRYNSTNYRHATLGYALSEINPVLSQFGLSLSWKTRQEDKTIFVRCVLTHELGHSEENELFGAPDASGQKNAIQQVASTVTYLKRHTAFALLGLEAEDADDDGRAASDAERITEEQAANIEALLEETGAKRDAFLTYWKISQVSDITAKAYRDVVASLERKRKKA